MGTEHTKTANDKTLTSLLDEASAAGRKVLLDFGATWCGPCRAIAPVLENVAKERAESLLVIKVDIDDSQDVTEQFGIRAVPTLIVIEPGVPNRTHLGALNKAQLERFIDNA